jgi:NAD(P)-dependent dehydrogenase (short-subunit alcohol dehydrogenase family)
MMDVETARFTGKAAVVTGAGAGLGRTIALRLAAEGAAVTVADIDPQHAAAVAAEIEASGGRAIHVGSDVSKPADVGAMIEAGVDAFGRLDILVNNAGVRVIVPFLEQSLEQWQWMIDVMLTGPMLCSQAAIPHMLEVGRGKIVNVGSVTGIIGLTKRAAYAAAKAGLHGLTRALAYELSSQGIWVNAVAPGLMETPMNTAYYQDEQFMQLVRRELPVGRLGKPDEIASVILFLASDESDFVSGATWTVDGGWTSGKGY